MLAKRYFEKLDSQLRSASFLNSYPDTNQLNRENRQAQFVFIGKSNTGKSSLINFLTGRKGLAKTSTVPGKTRLINLFRTGGDWVLTDLPGFGYAKLSQNEKKKLGHLLTDFLTRAENIALVFYLKDSRRDWSGDELEWLNLLARRELPMILVLTKADKLKQKERHNLLRRHQQALNIGPENIVVTSTLAGTGRETIIEAIGLTLRAGEAL